MKLRIASKKKKANSAVLPLYGKSGISTLEFYNLIIIREYKMVLPKPLILQLKNRLSEWSKITQLISV